MTQPAARLGALGLAANLALVLVSASAEDTVIKSSPTPPGGEPNRHYLSNHEPLLPSPLAKFPVGSVRPEGWLRHQLDLGRQPHPRRQGAAGDALLHIGADGGGDALGLAAHGLASARGEQQIERGTVPLAPRRGLRPDRTDLAFGRPHSHSFRPARCPSNTAS